MMFGNNLLLLTGSICISTLVFNGDSGNMTGAMRQSKPTGTSPDAIA